jgi:hypothetical protein
MRRLVLIPVVLLTFAGCSSSDGDSDVPSCSSVWKNGATLPSDYDGCMNSKTLEALVTVDCDDGSQLTTYDDRFYAVLGQTIHWGTVKDPAYAKTFMACSPDP